MILDLIFVDMRVISSSVFDFYKIRYAVSAIFGPTYLSFKRKEFGPNIDIQQNLHFTLLPKLVVWIFVSLFLITYMKTMSDSLL